MITNNNDKNSDNKDWIIERGEDEVGGERGRVRCEEGGSGREAAMEQGRRNVDVADEEKKEDDKAVDKHDDGGEEDDVIVVV